MICLPCLYEDIAEAGKHMSATSHRQLRLCFYFPTGQLTLVCVCVCVTDDECLFIFFLNADINIAPTWYGMH